jgi:pimeloyl-ACP methyl ester carboxylesterase
MINAQTGIVSEQFLLLKDSIKLPGTLTYNKSSSKQPLVIYIHGSGNVDRNGNQAGAVNANYIKQLSVALNQNNIAFYRYDKRTSNTDNMKYLMAGVKLSDFVDDVKIAVSTFKYDSRFSSISLIGHSQGSLIGMLAINEDIDKYISLAGPALSIDKSITNQIRKRNGDSLAGIAASHFKELRNTGTIKNVNPILFQIFNPQNLPFFKSWMNYNPEEEIKNIDIPVLIINGTKDLQVSIEDAKVLHQANPGSELVIIENMNHILKSIENDEDNFKTYTSSDFPVSEELIQVISDFVK